MMVLLKADGIHTVGPPKGMWYIVDGILNSAH